MSYYEMVLFLVVIIKWDPTAESFGPLRFKLFFLQFHLNDESNKSKNSFYYLKEFIYTLQKYSLLIIIMLWLERLKDYEKDYRKALYPAR